MKKKILLWLSLLAWAYAERPGESWRQHLTELPGGSGCSSSLCLQDDEGNPLLAWRERTAMLPASTLKTVTAAAIAEKGGLSEQLHTRLELHGHRVCWRGDYDPELSSAQLEDLALKLAQKIPGSRVELEVPPADPEPYPPGWSWDDLSSSFAPPPASLVFDQGLIPLKLMAGPPLRIAGPVWSPSGALATLPRAGDFEMLVIPGWQGWVMAGQLTPGTEEAATVPMLRPELSVASLLTAVFRRRGLEVELVAPTTLVTPVDAEAVQDSRPVSEILKRALAESDNLAMECLYRRFGKPLPSALAGETGLRIVDGSGLSRYDLISTSQLLKVLQSRPEVVGLLPRAGLDGTMKRRFVATELAGKVQAKTGTLSGVSGLVGELQAASGRRLRFALLLQGFVGPSQPFKKAEEDLLLELARQF